MLIEILAVPAEFLLGVMIGFFLSDKEDGLSIEEIKVSSLIFLIINAFMFLVFPNRNPYAFFFLTISWIFMNFGMLIGELVRLYIIQRVINATCPKQDLQVAITEFVRATNQYTLHARPDLKKVAETKLEAVERRLDQLSDHSFQFSDDIEAAPRILRIKSLCAYYLDVADDLNTQESNQRKALLVAQLSIKGDAILDLAWHTFSKNEGNIRAKLRKSYPLRVARLSMTVGTH